MSKLLAFLGGAGKGVLEGIEKAETNAKEEALLRIKKLSESFEKTKEENKKLSNNLKEEAQWITNTFSNATPEQIAFLQGNPPALEALKKMKDPTKLDLSLAINIAASGKPASSVISDIEAAPDVMDKVTGAVKSAAATPAYRSGLAGFYDQFGDQAAKSAEMRYARMLGTDVQTMEALKPIQRPSVAGTFDASLLRDQPGSVEEIAKAAKVERFQAGQKFGKDSEQYKQADAAVKEVESEIGGIDKKIEDRRDRLELQREDNKGDPAIVAALTKEIDGLNKTIKDRREATSTKSEREGKGDDKIKYTNAKTRMEDYMNTDMTMNKGLGWRKYVEEKVVKDPATGNTIVIPGKKVGLTPAQEKEYIEGMTAARMQGLKDLGLVTEKGQPINNEVKSLMTAYGLNRPTAAPAPAPAPATPAPATPAPATPAPATPAAIPTAQPASNKMPAPKTQAEYDAIPPNTEYMDTDGKIKRKGGK